jgi:hypothetical protein
MDTDLIDSGALPALPALEGGPGLFLKHSGGLTQLIYRGRMFEKQASTTFSGIHKG